MKPMISSIGAFSALIMLVAPMATAQTCAQQAAALQDRQVEAQEIADARLILVEQVEAAGDAWDEVEVHRLASAGHADTADQAKAEYDALKADLLQKDQSLQALVASLNEDVAAYNQQCVTD